MAEDVVEARDLEAEEQRGAPSPTTEFKTIHPFTVLASGQIEDGGEDADLGEEGSLQNKPIAKTRKKLFDALPDDPLVKGPNQVENAARSSPQKVARFDVGSGNGSSSNAMAQDHLPPLVPPRGEKLIRVLLRTRPTPEGEDNSMIIVDKQKVRTIPPADNNLAKAQGGRDSYAKEFDFDAVLDDQIGQDITYRETAAHLVDRVLSGSQSALLLAYGVTNSGKTHSIFGVPSNPGILPRALETILGRENSKPVTISALEVYREKIYDLMDLDGSGPIEPNGEPKALGIRTSNRQYVASCLSRHDVREVGLQGAIDMLSQGQSRRHVASNAVNARSSRSHSVWIVEIGEGERASTLWIVDLAGSERQERTLGLQGKTEANSINQSIMTLWRCLAGMQKMREGKSGTIMPFRESKLTLLLQGHLQRAGPGDTVVLVNVSMSANMYDETQHVLQNSAVAQGQVLLPPDLERPMTTKRKQVDQALKLASATKKSKRARHVQQRSESSLATLADNANLKNEVEALRQENEELTTLMADLEARVRHEAAIEMGEMMEDMEEQLKSLREQQRGAATPSISAKKFHETKLKGYIRDVEDQLAECEDEIERLRVSHAEEVVALQAELAEVQDQLASMEELHRAEITEMQAATKEQISVLKEELLAAQDLAQSLKQSHASEMGELQALNASLKEELQKAENRNISLVEEHGLEISRLQIASACETANLQQESSCPPARASTDDADNVSEDADAQVGSAASKPESLGSHLASREVMLFLSDEWIQCSIVRHKPRGRKTNFTLERADDSSSVDVLLSLDVYGSEEISGAWYLLGEGSGQAEVDAPEDQSTQNTESLPVSGKKMRLQNRKASVINEEIIHVPVSEHKAGRRSVEKSGLENSPEAPPRGRPAVLTKEPSERLNKRLRQARSGPSTKFLR